MHMSDHISLLQLNQQIKQELSNSFPDTLWIVAEISEIRTVRSGHCYLELVEKDDQSDEIKAKVRATIWAYTFRMLKPYFETSTKQPLSSGIKVLVKASIEFQELYGLSLNIKDIDPSFTLGDIARKRLEIIQQLEDEGVMHMNKEVLLNEVPQKLAIISSPSAAGYEDFINQLDNNPAGYKIYHKLFAAVMQGNEAEQSIISALDRIYQYEDRFDAVVIIRGGGSTADLMCFDNYWIALNIAQFPLPVLTGIGHERDETVCDLVAHTKLKTPTAVAEYIIHRIDSFSDYLYDLQSQIVDESRQLIKNHTHRLELSINTLQPSVKNILSQKKRQAQETAHRLNFVIKSYFDQQQSFITHVKESIHYLTKKQVKTGLQLCHFQQTQLRLELAAYLKNKEQQLKIAEKTATLSDPTHVLKRGYSITFHNKQTVRDTQSVNQGDAITTQLHKGYIVSRVEKIID